MRICLHRDVFNLRQAVEFSDRALASVEKATRNFERLIGIWDSCRNDKRVTNALVRKQINPPVPTTGVFLSLFWETRFSSSKLSGRCMELFGAHVVESAVSREVTNPDEMYEVLSQFDKEAFEHLRPPPQQAPAPPLQQAPRKERNTAVFNEGDRVIVTHPPAHRGKKAIVEQSRGDGKCKVKLIENGKSYQIKASNLRIDSGEEDSSSSEEEEEEEDSDGMPQLDSRYRSSSEDSSSGSDRYV